MAVRSRFFCADTKSACRSRGIDFPGKKAVLNSAEWRNLMAGMVESRDRPLNIMGILGGYMLPHDRLTPRS